MKQARLDGRQRSKYAVMRKLSRDLQLPGYFGGNLDALFDVLTNDVAGPITIFWRSTSASRAGIGRDYGRIVATLEDAASERDDLTLDIK